MLDMDEDGKIQIFELDTKYHQVYDNFPKNQPNSKAFSMPPEEHLTELFRRYDVDDDNKISRNVLPKLWSAVFELVSLVHSVPPNKQNFAW